MVARATNRAQFGPPLPQLQACHPKVKHEVRIAARFFRQHTQSDLVRILIGAPAPRRRFLVIDKPTKLASERILVGRPANRREFLIIDKPTKTAVRRILVGQPASRPVNTAWIRVLAVLDRKFWLPPRSFVF